MSKKLRLVSFSTLWDEMEKSSLCINFLWKCIQYFYSILYQGYKWRIDIGSGHGVNTCFSTSLSPKQTPVINAADMESTNTHLPPLILLWWSGKHFPKRAKLEQFPQTNWACLDPPYPQFLLLCRRQGRSGKITTTRVWSVAEQSSPAAGAMPHRSSCDARTRAALPITTRILQNPDPN